MNILPAHCYQDPATVVEQNQLRELGCKACKKHTHYLGKLVCTEPKKHNTKGIPHIGSQCKFFELKD